MTSVFGHGVPYLPYPRDRYSHGPDQCSGPAPCRGEATGCYRSGYDLNYNDHSCCCDPCRHLGVDLCAGGCCRCVPRHLCVTFTPDTVDDVAGCKIRGWLMPAAADTAGKVTYGLNLPGLGATTITVNSPEVDSYYPYANCLWRLTAPDAYVDSEWVIDHAGDSTGGVTCVAPPTMTIANINVPVTRGSTTTNCYGTYTIEPWTMTRVPFDHKYPEMTNANAYVTPSTSCGYCTEFCKILCVVRKGTDDVFQTEDDLHDEFTWSEYNQRWEGGVGGLEIITPIEYGGVCHLELTTLSYLNTLQGDLIEIDSTACSIGMALTITDEAGDYLKVSCHPCNCWAYKCETCRCVPDQMCVVGMLNNAFVSAFAVTWNQDDQLWEDGLGFEVGLINDGLKPANCAVSVTGLVTADTIVVDGACGAELEFVASKDPDLSFVDGLETWYAGWRKGCADCDAGTCLSNCTDVPDIIYATVNASDFQVEGAYLVEYPCFDAFSVPMGLMYSSAAAGEFRWQGSLMFDCNGVIYRIALDFGCDGSLNITITDGVDGSPSHTCQHLNDLVAPDVPCTDVMSGEVLFSDCAIGCCGSDTRWTITFSE